MPHRWLIGKDWKTCPRNSVFLSVITVKPVGHLSQGKSFKWKQKRSSAWMSRRFGIPLKRRLKFLPKSFRISFVLKTTFWHSSYPFATHFPNSGSSRPRPRLPGCSGESRDQVCHQGGRKGQAGAECTSASRTNDTWRETDSGKSICQEGAEEKKRLLKVWRSSLHVLSYL